MDVIKKITYFISIFIYSIRSLYADTLEVGKSKFKTVFNFYQQSSSSGIQVIDESGDETANVIEPMFFFQHQISENTNINANFVFDSWTAASDTSLDANTGASGNHGIGMQGRFSVNSGIQHEKGDWNLGANVGISNEYDYRSINSSLNIAKSFAQKNFTLGLGIQYYADTVGLFQDITPPIDARMNKELERNIIATSLTAAQLLTSKDIIQFGFNFIQASKNLESTASTVLVNGIREFESLPDSRNRYAFSTNWVHGITENSSLHTNYRYYNDDWNLKAHSLKLSYLLETNEEDEDFIEFSFRGHSQSAVKYFASSFKNIEKYMTSDSDLAEFTSTEFGVHYRNYLGNSKLLWIDLPEAEWSTGLVYNSRSNGLDYTYLQTSLGMQF